MVGLVIVSHSASLAEGAVELAREMAPDVAMAAAGGLDDGAIGTDATRVMAAIDDVRSADGVLVLMDLGSALMSADMAREMVDPDGGPVELSAAPVVEGAVAAAVRAQGGASLQEVVDEARGALAAKRAQLGEDVDASASPAADTGIGPAGPSAPADSDGGIEGEELVVALPNRLGLHARPIARIVALVAEHSVSASVRNVSRGSAPADGRSLTALATLGARQGDDVAFTAAGPGAGAFLAAIAALVDDNLGDPPDDAPSVDLSVQETNKPTVDGELRGVAASSGIAIGPARRLAPPEPELPGAPAGDPDEECAALDEAREAVRADLEAAQRSLRARGAGGEAEIFAAHAALLDDAALLEPARRAIEDGAAAARAWHDAATQAAAAFRALEDGYLRERAVDVEDVRRAVVAQLTGTDAAPVLAAPGIVLAGELTPREAAALDPERALAVATERGGATGHAAIVARALGIPAVVGLGPALAQIEDGTELALDGDAGTVVVAPDAETSAALARRRDEAAAAREAALARARERVTLPDGREVEVGANVGNAAEAQRAVVQGADGVGLLRTEFLFLDRATAPSEDEQVAALRAIAEALEGRRVVVRTLDAGADKPLPFLPHRTEDNPFLGVRGVRLSLTVPELFETQLRAIARVAEEFPLAVMFPMVATLEELRAARRHLENARSAVGGSAPLEVGVMVEVPALALQAAEFAPEVDFFSVGTNDLTQYTMAADRGSGELAGLLAGAQAPVLRLIAQVTEAAAAHGPWVGVCGELAGDPEAAVLLAALGVTELSMAGSRIAAVKAALREADLQRAAATLGALLGPGAAAAR